MFLIDPIHILEKGQLIETSKDLKTSAPHTPLNLTVFGIKYILTIK